MFIGISHRDIDVDIQGIINYLKIHGKSNRNAFEKLKLRNGWYMCCCPFHEENRPSFGISTDYPYSFNCFACKEKGTLEELVSRVMLVSPLQAIKIIKENSVYSARNNIRVHEILNAEDIPYVDEELVEKYKKKRHSYMYSRGFSDYTLTKYEIGYDEETDTITFPVRDLSGGVRFIQRRAVGSKQFFNESNLRKKDVLYGLYYIVKSPKLIREVYLVESATDVLACYEMGLPAVAVLGSVLFEPQVTQLMRAGINKVNIFFDNDKYGEHGANLAYSLLKKYPIAVSFVEYLTDHKDPNDVLLGGGKSLLKIKGIRGIFSE